MTLDAPEALPPMRRIPIWFVMAAIAVLALLLAEAAILLSPFGPRNGSGLASEFVPPAGYRAETATGSAR